MGNCRHPESFDDNPSRRPDRQVLDADQRVRPSHATGVPEGPPESSLVRGWTAPEVPKGAALPALWVTLERRSVQARARRRLRRSQHRLFVAEDAAPVWIVEAKAIGALGD